MSGFDLPDFELRTPVGGAGDVLDIYVEGYCYGTVWRTPGGTWDHGCHAPNAPTPEAAARLRLSRLSGAQEGAGRVTPEENAAEPAAHEATRRPTMTDEFVPGYPSKCSTCGAPVIRGLKTPAGKSAILDREPREDGNIEILGGKAVTLTAVVKAAPPSGPRYVSHWATCKDREDWKARKVPR